MSVTERDGPRIAAELRAEQAEADAVHWRSEAMRHVERVGVIEQQLQGAVEALAKRSTEILSSRLTITAC